MTRQLLLVCLLALGFASLSLAVALGALDGLDAQVAVSAARLWRDQLALPFLGIALLGGAELTSLVALGLAMWLRRHGFPREAWVIVVLPVAELLELAYKRLVHHPGPARSLSHGDAPSLSELVPAAAVGNSFPSGHMLRTALVYGLVAFVVYRLSRSGPSRTLVVVVTVALGTLMALDRIYLGVHWTSDVAGGILLGGLFLALSATWLDRGVPAL